MHSIFVTVSLFEDWAVPFIFHWNEKKKQKKTHIRLQLLAIKNFIQEYIQPISLACTRTEFQRDHQFGNLSSYRNTVLHCAVKLCLISILFGWHSSPEYIRYVHSLSYIVGQPLPVVADVVVVVGSER